MDFEATLTTPPTAAVATAPRRIGAPRSCKRRILAQLPCPNEIEEPSARRRKKSSQDVAAASEAGAVAEGSQAQVQATDAPADEECIHQSVAGCGFDVNDLKAYIAMLPPSASLKLPGCPIPIKGESGPKISLVLDLDETLVHSSTLAIKSPDYVFPVHLRGTEYSVYVRLRPHVFEFMERMSKIFEIIVFTASQKLYADALLDLLDPCKQFIQHRVFRESCVVVEGNYLKDLRVLGRDLAHTVIVDNSPISFGYQLDNGVPIKSWFSAQEDRELLKLAPFLEGIAHADDVRPHITKRFWQEDNKAVVQS